KSSEKGSTLGWLVCIDQNAKIGTLYQPPGMLPLKEIIWSADNRISFSSDSFTGDQWYYRFEGSIQEGSLAGRLSKFTRPSNSVVRQSQLEPVALAESEQGV